MIGERHTDDAINDQAMDDGNCHSTLMNQEKLTLSQEMNVYMNSIYAQMHQTKMEFNLAVDMNVNNYISKSEMKLVDGKSKDNSLFEIDHTREMESIQDVHVEEVTEALSQLTASQSETTNKVASQKEEAEEELPLKELDEQGATSPLIQSESEMMHAIVQNENELNFNAPIEARNSEKDIVVGDEQVLDKSEVSASNTEMSIDHQELTEPDSRKMKEIESNTEKEIQVLSPIQELNYAEAIASDIDKVGMVTLEIKPDISEKTEYHSKSPSSMEKRSLSLVSTESNSTTSNSKSDVEDKMSINETVSLYHSEETVISASSSMSNVHMKRPKSDEKESSPSLNSSSSMKDVKSLDESETDPSLVSSSNFKGTPLRKKVKGNINRPFKTPLRTIPPQPVKPICTPVQDSSRLEQENVPVALMSTPAKSSSVSSKTPQKTLLTPISINLPETKFKTPLVSSSVKAKKRMFRQPFKSPLSSTPSLKQKDSAQLCELKSLQDEVRKMEFVQKLLKQGSNDDLVKLIQEWKRASREALTFLRDKLGPVQIPTTCQHPQQRSNMSQPEGAPMMMPQFGNAWDNVYAQNTAYYPSSSSYEQEGAVRVLTLKEMAMRMSLDIKVFGDYDEEGDCFL